MAAGIVPDIEAMLLQGQLLLSQGSYVLAQNLLRRAVAISPLSPVALASLAMAVVAVRRSTEGGSARGGSTSSGDVVGGSGSGGNNHTISHLLHGREDGEDDDDDENDMAASSLSAGIQVSFVRLTCTLSPSYPLSIFLTLSSILSSLSNSSSAVGGLCHQIVLSGD